MARCLAEPLTALSTTPALQPLSQEQMLRRNVKRFRGGIVFKAHGLVYHSTLGLRVIKKKKTSACAVGVKG